MVNLLVCTLLLQASDPHEAYRKKAYDQALQGFLDMQVRHPDDPVLMLNVGSTYYQLKDYPQAEKAFSQAAAAATDNVPLKQAAVYDLGNCAFHQGKLEAAVQHYREALALNSNDMDARRNLELAERELQRRRQQAQQQPQQNQGSPQNPNQEQQQPQQSSEPKPPQSEKNPPTGQDGQQNKSPAGGEDGSPAPPGSPDKPSETPQPAKPRDKPGETENGAAKPARPGETENGAPKPAHPGETVPGKPGQTLSPEQAERYLRQVGESRPKRRSRNAPMQRMPNGKDW